MSKDTEKNIVLPTDALCAEMRSKGLVYADGRTAVLYDMGKKGAGTDLSTLGYGNNDVVKVTAKEDGTYEVTGPELVSAALKTIEKAADFAARIARDRLKIFGRNDACILAEMRQALIRMAAEQGKG